jgi:hypothetical protein
MACPDGFDLSLMNQHDGIAHRRRAGAVDEGATDEELHRFPAFPRSST